MVRFFGAVSATILVALVCGCSFSSNAVKAPGIDPSAAAEAAIAQYDQDNDQGLSEKEIEESALTLELWDSSKDGQIQKEEIQQRLEQYIAQRTGMVGLQCNVYLGNMPLGGAEVTFEPEEFLGGVVHPAYGMTVDNGVANLSVAEEFRPDPAIRAVEIGLYRVRITHPDVPIREEFNTNTKLSYDVSPLENLVPPRYRVRR